MRFLTELGLLGDYKGVVVEQRPRNVDGDRRRRLEDDAAGGDPLFSPGCSRWTASSSRWPGSTALSTFQSFRLIVLPLLTPVILIVLVLRTIQAFKVFDIIWIMTGGGPANATQTIAIYAYQTAFQGYDFGWGAALGDPIALIIMGLAAIYLRLLGRTGRV